jgi:hypothetical protein
MAAILPILVTGVHLLLVSDQVPELNITPSCRAAAGAAIALNRSAENCERSEIEARDKLQQQWSDYTNEQQGHCVRLSSLGGSPSYIELLTCLEIDKASKSLPPEIRAKQPFSRQGNRRPGSGT